MNTEKETDKLCELKEAFFNNTDFKSIESIIKYLQCLEEKEKSFLEIYAQEKISKEAYQNELINAMKKLNEVSLELAKLKTIKS